MPQRDTFTVDTQLFRELGELLVGRDSTALAELVKNSYDADATVVRLIGQYLGDGEAGKILVVDDGTGMTSREFRVGYLTIAGRGKTTGDRRSRRFGRRFTGEKGIGRLATHKLAHHLDVQSVAAARRAETGRAEVRAMIDWDAVERYPTIVDIQADALKVEEKKLGKPRRAGTAVTLTRLRHDWSDPDIAQFLVELGQFEPPMLIVEPRRFLIPTKLLLGRLKVRDVSDSDDQFKVELGGDFDRSEDLWTEVANQASWVVEVASLPNRVRIAVAPTPLGADRVGERRQTQVDFEPIAGPRQPSFSARLYARENARGTRRTREFFSQAAGIRVYMEGFRVPPYGGQGDDWLELDKRYARRSERLNLDLPGMPTAPPGREGLRGLPNNAYVGGVFLTRVGAPGLEMLINREGFVPAPALEAVRETMRIAVDLLTRVRAGYGVAEGTAEREETLLAPELRVRDGLASAAARARTLRTVVADVGAAALRDDIEQLSAELDELGEVAERAVADRSLLRIVASVGTQMAAFVHETQGLAGAAASVSRALGSLADANPKLRRQLLDLRHEVAVVGARIESQARYLSDATAVGNRRRRQRLKVAERLAATLSLLEPAAGRLAVTIEERVDPALRTVAMYPGELTVVLTNLLTNAIKAAGPRGRVRVEGERDDDNLVIRVANTGIAVDPAEGEQWFAPFASTTIEQIDPLLGQGMGLGLPITRSVIEDYRGSVHFVKPPRGFKTQIEVRLP